MVLASTSPPVCFTSTLQPNYLHHSLFFFLSFFFNHVSIAFSPWNANKLSTCEQIINCLRRWLRLSLRNEKWKQQTISFEKVYHLLLVKVWWLIICVSCYKGGFGEWKSVTCYRWKLLVKLPSDTDVEFAQSNPDQQLGAAQDAMICFCQIGF